MDASSIDHLMQERFVKARHQIIDSPLSLSDSSVKRGQRGEIVDLDFSANLIFVDFGNGAIACTPDEVTPISDLK